MYDMVDYKYFRVKLGKYLKITNEVKEQIKRLHCILGYTTVHDFFQHYTSCTGIRSFSA